MKLRIFIVTAVCVLILYSGAVFSEAYTAVQIETGEEWSWDPGNYNLFSGHIQLSSFAGQELTVAMTTDLSYDDGEEHNPLFTVIDGKRIPMRQQSNRTVYTPAEGTQSLSFSGSITLPAKEHVKHIVFQFHILDVYGNELALITDEVSVWDNDPASVAGSFYISCNTGRIAAIAGGAAIVIWAVVLIRSLLIRKKKRTGE